MTLGSRHHVGRFLRGRVILVEFLTQALTCGDGMGDVAALSVGDLLFEHGTPIALLVDLHLLVDTVRHQKADCEHIRLHAIYRSGDGDTRSRMLYCCHSIMFIPTASESYQ